MDKTDAILDPSLIALVDGIVYELDGDIFAVNPANVDTNFPDGIDAKTQLFIIDSKTGAVSSNPLYTWSTTDNVIICQNCKVTYTDIWGNKASKTVLLRVMSNAVPSPVQP